MVGAVTGVAQRPHTLVHRRALHIAGEVLEQERHAPERPVRDCARRGLARLLVQRMDHGVQLQARQLGARDCVIHKLGGRRLVVADEAGLLGCVGEHDVTSRLGDDRLDGLPLSPVDAERQMMGTANKAPVCHGRVLSSRSRALAASLLARMTRSGPWHVRSALALKTVCARVQAAGAPNRARSRLRPPSAS